MTEREAIEKLRGEISKAGSQRALAKAWGLSDAYISDVLSGRRDLGPTILLALGLDRVVTYRERSGA